MLNVIMNFETIEGTLTLLVIALLIILFLGLPMFLMLKTFEYEEKEYQKYFEEKLKNNEPIVSGAPMNNMFTNIALMNTTIFTTI